MVGKPMTAPITKSARNGADAAVTTAQEFHIRREKKELDRRLHELEQENRMLNRVCSTLITAIDGLRKQTRKS